MNRIDSMVFSILTLFVSSGLVLSQNQPEQRVVLGHGFGVDFVIFSPDDKTLAFVLYNKVRLFYIGEELIRTLNLVDKNKK
jgi:hypothetical protein